ncbi:ScbR family autoregulator-binding transcription factor [Arthrobacter sp. B2a2-09]|uniref:ScbR family autoregulator-binding transcription factor n=1 Tax=Arthrobacter sp. B2a2-09 TaxID=2952822 RepID=UPI0022CD33C5|nr:ScbR family autoregulator-binding transcription factor [Arthrobacter sp. B2a2-09]MCZ9883644.1 TetR/AcrR family transcriptional regulator [Arthrobacter sp. B2a2-09]
MVLQGRAKATRETIIAGAAKVFAEHGYGTSSITLVADAAQVTKGALYFHFKSKDELARAVLDEQHAVAVRTGEAILAENGTALTTMINLCGAFGTQLANDQIFRAGIRLTLEASAFGQTARGPYEDWIATLARLAEQGITEGQIRPSVEPLALARYIVASFTGVQMVSNILTGRDDVMNRIQEMWEILLPGIMREDSAEDPKELAGLISRKHTDRRRKVSASA